LLHQEALLLEQIDYWRVRGAKEAEMRQSWEVELEAHQKFMEEELNRLHGETEANQVMLDEQYKAQEAIDAQILSLEAERKYANDVSSLMEAELRIANQKVHDVRILIKGKHRRRLGGAQGELSSNLTEAEFDSFREKIGTEFEIQLQELPIQQVRQVISSIVMSDAKQKEVRFSTSGMASVLRARAVAKEWKKQSLKQEYTELVGRSRSEGTGSLPGRLRSALARQTTPDSVVSYNSSKSDASPAGSSSPGSRERSKNKVGKQSSVGRVRSKDKEDKEARIGRTPSRHKSPPKDNRASSKESEKLSSGSKAAETRSPSSHSVHSVQSDGSNLVERTYEDAVDKLKSVGIHM
jgi:hypothetical protein